MSRYNGLIIPRSYNDYFSRSDPADLLRLVQQTTDAELDPNSTNPLQNQAIAQIVPNAATPENPLTDRNFVNSTVGTNTANYIYKTNAGDENVPFDSIAELEAYSGTVTQNDYAFVTGIDENGNKYFDRYKANVDGSVITWAKEYRLNNSSFTAEQWAAIQSGITAAKVTQFEQGIVPSNANACICTTGATTAAKTGTAPSSFVLAAGAKISVLFTNASQTNRPTLNINGKGAKNIKVYQHGTKINLPNHTINNVVTYWQAGTTLDLIYDGTDWVVMGNPVVASNASADSGYTVYANGYMDISINISANSIIVNNAWGSIFESTSIDVKSAITSSGYPIPTKLINKTLSLVYCSSGSGCILEYDPYTERAWLVKGTSGTTSVNYKLRLQIIGY